MRLILSLLLALLVQMVKADSIPWRRLEFGLDALFTVKAKLHLETKAQAELLQKPGALEPETPSLYHLEIETLLKWFLAHRAWDGDLWFEPEDFSALQRVRTKLGKRGYRKVFRYGEKGVWRIRYRLGEDPPQEQFFLKPALLPCPKITDPYALLLILSQPKLPKRLCVFNKEEFYRLDLQHVGVGRLEVAYRDGKREVRRTLELEKVQLIPTPLGQMREVFEFLGMEGEILFWRDPKAGLIFRIEGKVPNFGHAVLDLRRVDR